MNILLAGSDRRLNNLIEPAVLDVCFNHAAVHCTRTGRLQEFLRLAAHPGYDLVLMAGDNLLAGSGSGAGWASQEAVLDALRAASLRCSAPILVVGARPEEGYRFLEAGADYVLSAPFHGDHFKIKVGTILNVPQRIEAPEPTRASWADFLVRPFQRAKVPGLKRASRERRAELSSAN